VGEPGEDARVHAEERGVVERRDPGVGPEVGGAAEGPQRRLGRGEGVRAAGVEEERLRVAHQPHAAHRSAVEVPRAVPFDPRGQVPRLLGGAGGEGDDHPTGERARDRLQDGAHRGLVGDGHDDDLGGADHLPWRRRGRSARADEGLGAGGRPVPDGRGVARRQQGAGERGAQAPDAEHGHREGR
jgi:hypothetical protein